MTVPQQIQAVLDTAAITIAHFRHRPDQAVPHLYRLLDACTMSFLETHQSACKAGCSASCCKQGKVAVSPSEALYIAHTCKDLPKARIRQFIEDGIDRCPLLDANNRCSIYMNRPLQCRAYNVPDASKCNESFGATSLLAAQLQEMTFRYQKLNLANALLVAMSSRSYGKWLKGDDQLWLQ